MSMIIIFAIINAIFAGINTWTCLTVMRLKKEALGNLDTSLLELRMANLKLRNADRILDEVKK